MQYEKPRARRQPLAGLMDVPSDFRILCPQGTHREGDICVPND